MPFPLPTSIRSFAAEPAVPGAPARVWRDWALVGISSIVAIGEAALRTDHDWVALPFGWQVASVVFFFATVPIALLIRRTRPLLATAWAFVPTMLFGVTMSITEGIFGGLTTTAVMLVAPYALYRWGSGRDGLFGVGFLLAALVVGNAATPGVTLGDWIGGFIVLTIPVEAGLIVRYQRTARDRALDEARARQRTEIARELHDTVAHYVSAIAIQAQAGRALAATDPERALGTLAVIEDAASRTLAEMRSIVHTLRNDNDADLTPQKGVADLTALAGQTIGDLGITVVVDPDLGDLSQSIDAALFRIGQESLTNAARHARAARSITILVDADGSAVRMTVTDDGQSPEGRTNNGLGQGIGQGLGLVGMAERAELLGGRLHAGPTDKGGWQVIAELPRDGVGPLATTWESASEPGVSSSGSSSSGSSSS